MSRYPLLVSPTFVYTRLKAIIWCESGTAYITQVEAAAGRALAAILHGLIRDGNTKPLVINCRGVLTIDDRALDAIKAMIADLSFPVVFCSVNYAVASRLAAELGPPITRDDTGDDCYAVFAGVARKSDEWQEMLSSIKDAEDLEVATFIRDCYQAHEGGGKMRVSSTPLKSSGVLNARKIIAKSHSFVWACLKMADIVDELIRSSHFRQSQGRLLAVSLRASPFAAAIAFLLTGRPFEVEIVDHLGPHHAVLEEDYLRPSGGALRYVFIGDFILGGTELKIAQYYARTKGAILEHAIALGRLLPRKAYGPRVDVRTLVSIPECCPEAEFELGLRDDDAESAK